jgi:hypothetical protein
MCVVTLCGREPAMVSYFSEDEIPCMKLDGTLTDW